MLERAFSWTRKSHLCTWVMFSLALAQGLTVAEAGEVTLKFALIHPENDHTEVIAAKAFGRYIESASGGEIKVRYFYGTLGGAREIAEQLQQGLLDYASLGDGSMTSFYPQLQVFSIPYLFRSEAVAWNVFQGDFARKMQADILDTTGLRVLAFAQNGFRILSNNVRPIKRPEDLKGVRIRTQESQAYIELVSALGGTAIPMGFPELISSLQQGIVDGQENALNDIIDTGIIRVQKYASLNNHTMGLQVILTNESFFQSLTSEQQQILQDAAKYHAAALNYLKTNAAVSALDTAKEMGIEVHVNTPEEKEEFKNRAQGAVKAYVGNTLGADLVEALLKDINRAENEIYGAGK